MPRMLCKVSYLGVVGRFIMEVKEADDFNPNHDIVLNLVKCFLVAKPNKAATVQWRSDICVAGKLQGSCFGEWCWLFFLAFSITSKCAMLYLNPYIILRNDKSTSKSCNPFIKRPNNEIEYWYWQCTSMIQHSISHSLPLTQTHGKIWCKLITFAINLSNSSALL